MKSSLILEGGANRGIFTSGVLDYLLENRFWFDYVIGISAGACNAIDYVSDQKDRSKDCIIAWNKESVSERVSSFRKSHNIIDYDMLFSEFPRQQYPFDFNTYFASDIVCELGVTNCITGKAEYLSVKDDEEKLLSVCRASSSMPCLTHMVEIDNVPYLDGGIADSVPIRHVRSLGYKKNVLILTQQKGYRKKRSPKTEFLVKSVYHNYPELVKTFCRRPYRYNKCMDYIDKLEEEGKIFVIRPQMKPVSRLEKDSDKLIEFYNHGYEIMKNEFESMKNFIQKSSTTHRLKAVGL